MASVHAVYLKEDEVREIALKVLQRAFAEFGFSHVDVSEEEDFDGASIFRLTAHVAERVPARQLVDANYQVGVELRARGEERYAFLATHRPDADDVEDDEDLQ